ncbi:hypothetical protein M9Y10_043788 [Tritrichomonas musculus]|uniref:Flavodoxin-like domain-containing protein n=1 Tax=Tritrichomonas musculus TaxID=1915356 RepID=A0ABR2K0M6_9EUKA
MKILVAYFSATGVTGGLAKTIAEVTGGDLFEIKPAAKYSTADLDWQDKNSRTTKEYNDANCRPAITEKVPNFEQYNVVFLGFPIWWYEAPRIIQTFVESYDFSGKTVINFATSGVSTCEKADEQLKACCSPQTKWKTGKRFGSFEKSVVKSWVDGLGL